ncbi:DUF1194 domain-containing protein [Pseudoruegeria sp. SHC-113]|uniref:DUF1194 domain-containing protein n=1 Tax=Pseudoruegeria sp. SHC-113 TaxID=2855439 RepID=UPI0021BA61B8|nr:DUF1194 domain-containing protein [Pseudoruegeria sp. SHC-113]MCT8160600.1 DUF1194 domain-containing protein [Pseudoruegeria sp. SHC-113]
MRFLLALFFALAFPALAEEVEVELVLLADASGSISEAEIGFQRQGYAEALTDPRVLAAIERTAYQSIAVTYVEWAANTAVVVDWAKIDGPESARAFAEALLTPPRQAYGRNAIGGALLDAKRLIEQNEFKGWRKVIDFSGDSPNSFSGPPLEQARQEVVAAGITINGLPILCRFCDTPTRYPDLGKVYEERIIGGLGAFVVTATDEADLAEAIRRKLILEISGQMPAYEVAER